MPSASEQNDRFARWSPLAVLVLAGCVMLPLLGHRPLTDWDEGIYAQVSREMLGHSWLLPTWNGQPWFEKPPLAIWIVAIFYKLFGVSEWTARLPSALAGMAVVTVVHAWLRRQRGLLTAWLGAAIVLSTFGFLHIARVGETDTLLTLGCVVTLIGLSRVVRSESRGWPLFWGGFAVALMTKGAASVVLLPVLVVALVMARGKPGRSFWLSAAGFLAVVLPWHLYVYSRAGATFVQEYVGYHVLARAAVPIEGHVTAWWFFVWVLLVSAPPFALLLPWALPAGFRHKELMPWAVFLVVDVLLFSLAHTRLPHYVAPVYPALAVLVACLVADKLVAWRREWGMRRLVVSAVLPGLGVLIFSMAATAHARRNLHSARTGEMRAHDERESDALLKQVFGAGQGDSIAGGPLLVWRVGAPTSIATSVFYSGRPARQVVPGVVAAGIAIDRYDQNPQSMADALANGPRILLADTALLSALPAGMLYRRVAAGPTMEVGVIELNTR